jgi:hypothetical protein
MTAGIWEKSQKMFYLLLLCIERAVSGFVTHNKDKQSDLTPPNFVWGPILPSPLTEYIHQF